MLQLLIKCTCHRCFAFCFGVKSKNNNKKSGKNQCHSYYAIDCKEKQVNSDDKWPLWFALVIVSILQHPCGQTQFAGKVDVALVEPSNAVILVVDVVSDVLQILQVGPEQVFMDKVSTGIYCMVNKAKQLYKLCLYNICRFHRSLDFNLSMSFVLNCYPWKKNTGDTAHFSS